MDRTNEEARHFIKKRQNVGEGEG